MSNANNIYPEHSHKDPLKNILKARQVWAKLCHSPVPPQGINTSKDSLRTALLAEFLTLHTYEIIM